MQYITDYDAMARYRDFIDDNNPVVIIDTMAFTPSRVLEELDPTAFYCGLADYLDAIGMTTDESEADMDE